MTSLKEIFNKVLRSPHPWPVVIAVIAGLVFGLMISGGSPKVHTHGPESEDHGTEKKQDEIWTCSMHPQVKQPRPGKCPLCGMDLVQATAERGNSTAAEIKLSPLARRLADIQVALVERKFVSREIRMVGKIVVDETRLSHIASRISGRIDRMFVDYTGIRVRKGDHLVSIYSPELISAQEELQQAKKTYRSSNPRTVLRGTAERLLKASREKLRLWGLTNGQINSIEKAGKPQDHLTIFSPVKGIVIQKQAVEGTYVKTGSIIYIIADLSRVWIILDAYESDLSWIRYGQPVGFEVEAYPGEQFSGKIAFIDPVLNPTTRTVKVRINVENDQFRLKPEMFVRAVVRSKISNAGEAPIVIPATAPLITGIRAVVYVAVPGKEGVFRGRNIRLGPRAGGYYIVKEGLKEGEKVVANGAFKIDSDLQIQGKPSMMSPAGGEKPPSHDHQGHRHETDEGSVVLEKTAAPLKKKVGNPAKRYLEQLAGHYLALQAALGNDQYKEALSAGKSMLNQLEKVDMKSMSREVRDLWRPIHSLLNDHLNRLVKGKTIKDIRHHFSGISDRTINLVKIFKLSIERDLFLIHCPMANDNKGGYWLQKNLDIRNPYFGEEMLTCHDESSQLTGKRKKNQ